MSRIQHMCPGYGTYSLFEVSTRGFGVQLFDGFEDERIIGVLAIHPNGNDGTYSDLSHVVVFHLERQIRSMHTVV